MHFQLKVYELALVIFLAGVATAPASVPAAPSTWSAQAGGVESAVAAQPAQPAARLRPGKPPPGDSRGVAKAALDEAAARAGLPPSLVEAVAWWESGWDQQAVSSTGAIGLMQVQPESEADLAQRLIGRRANLHDLFDNALIGAEILKAFIDDFNGNVRLGLAAYYQGESSVRSDGLYPDGEAYADGIQALAAQIAAGQPPS